MTFILVCNAFETMALSTTVSLTNMNTCKTGALYNQMFFFLYFCYKTSLNAHPFSESHSVVNICFTVQWPEYYCGGNCGCVWFQFLRHMAQLPSATTAYYCGGNCGCVWFQFLRHMAQLHSATTAYWKTLQPHLLWVFSEWRLNSM